MLLRKRLGQRQPCCSGHGVCLNGHCSCAIGWAGAGCAPKTSDTAAAIAGAVAGCERGCSGHGVCSLGVSGVAFCTCALGWAGADCDVAAPCPSSCSGYGVCHYGKFLCAAGSLGADCSQVVTSGNGPFSECADDCSGAGICVNGPCECVPGFSGANGLHVDPCPLGCSGRGICEIRATSAACMCTVGYSGLGCEEAVLMARYEPQAGVVGHAQLVGDVTPCAANCSGRGVCVDDPDGGASCGCAVGDRGAACELENSYADATPCTLEAASCRACARALVELMHLAWRQRSRSGLTSGAKGDGCLISSDADTTPCTPAAAGCRACAY